MFEYTNTPSKSEPPKDMKALRAMLWNRVDTVQKYIESVFEAEARQYYEAYKHKFKDKRITSHDTDDNDVSINVFYPIIKSRVASLYYQDPRVIVKPLSEKIVKEIIGASGIPEKREFDGVRSARILQGALNDNMETAKLGKQVKSALTDALLSPYGVIKCGWDYNHGVFGNDVLSQLSPRSPREVVMPNRAFALRHEPWNVAVDLENFTDPTWVALKHYVHPDVLKKDPRFQHTESLHGTDMSIFNHKFSSHKDSSIATYSEPRVCYYEYYEKPNPSSPEGLYCCMTDEVDNEFLYLAEEWPYASTKLPIKFLYFNEDPLGGLPFPEPRMYKRMQRAANVLQQAQYEYVRRSIPIVVLNETITDQETTKQGLSKDIVPKVIYSSDPQRAINIVGLPSINPDFMGMRSLIDSNISRVTGLIKGVHTGGQGDIEFASMGKIADEGSKERNAELKNTLSDFVKDILVTWAHMYQQYASERNFTLIEGETFPVQWSREEIEDMRFHLDIKPFSMNYEDPIILRRQFADLLNLLGSPQIRAGIAQQGAQIDLLKMVKRVLATYDEKDVDSFIVDSSLKMENQVAKALQENEFLQQAVQTGVPVQQVAQALEAQKERGLGLEFVDNDKAHILIHGLLGDVAFDHIQQHVMQMQNKQTAATPGGGNKEGLPINGVAVDQEAMRAPLQPDIQNQMNRNQTPTRTE